MFIISRRNKNLYQIIGGNQAKAFTSYRTNQVSESFQKSYISTPMLNMQNSTG